MKQVKFANYDRKTQLMAVNFTDGTSRIYKGSGVVWFEYPSMVACETYVCSELFTMWSEIETFGGDYTPTKLPKGDWLMVVVIFILVAVTLATILGVLILKQ